MITIKQLEERVEKARRHVILDIPMAQASAVKMGIFFSDRIQTAATDGKSIGFNPPFVASINEEELEFVVVHEWGHKMLRHFARCLKIRSSFKGVWTQFHEDLLNEAADEEDNYFVEQCGFKIMDGACRDKRFDGMPMEETFQILLHERTMPEPDDDGEEIDGGNPGEETQDNEGGKQDDVSDGDEEEEESSGSQDGDEGNEEQGEGNDSGGEPNAQDQGDPRSSDDRGGEFGQDGVDKSASLSDEEVDDYKRPDVKDWGKLHTRDNPTISEIHEEEMDSKIDQSNDLAVAKLSGKLPENLERILKDLKDKSDVDWVAEMVDFVSEACGEDANITWRKPNKKFLWMDTYLPSTLQEGIGEIAVLIDSSGSMDEEMYGVAASETAHLINDVGPSKTHVLEFTTEITSVSSYEDSIEIDTMPDRSRWGGTDVCVGFDWVQENAPETTAIIVISDMEFFRWPEDTGVPVLWVKVPPRTDNSWYFGKPSFGKSITVL
mgnify:FL=1|tara:strand:- start:1397 stop:2875 length:1479 start_codon:yes stop_codon:yes gene_type:complete